MKINRKIKNNVKNIIYTFIAFILIAISYKLGIINIYESENENKIYKEKATNLNIYEVVRVVDGDTIVIEYNGVNEKVRMIGIDTPESVHPNEEKNTEFGKKVSEYTKKMLTGKNVEIEFDVQQRDKYGRLLCYVYVDEQMYNKLLLKEGLAKVATYPPNVKYVDEFVELQKEARNSKKGMWE